MQVKTSELSGAALDWAVAKSEGYSDWDGEAFNSKGVDVYCFLYLHSYHPSDAWVQGGPIIDREKIAIRPHEHDTQHWSAERPLVDFSERLSSFSTGDTALIAAMRCSVLSKLGNVVDIPDELI